MSGRLSLGFTVFFGKIINNFAIYSLNDEIGACKETIVAFRFLSWKFQKNVRDGAKRVVSFELKCERVLLHSHISVQNRNIILFVLRVRVSLCVYQIHFTALHR